MIFIRNHSASKRLILSLAVMLFGTATIAQPTNRAKPQRVSIIKLIANPKNYDGKLVQVGGYLSSRFEDTAVYVSENDYMYQFTENGIWIDVDQQLEEKVRKYDRRFGNVVGVFRAEGCGHLCLYSGSIRFVRFGLMYR